MEDYVFKIVNDPLFGSEIEIRVLDIWRSLSSTIVLFGLNYIVSILYFPNKFLMLKQNYCVLE